MSNEAITRNDLKAILNEIIPSFPMVDIFYPVGSYYETSDTSFDPNIAWGGTWVLETEGQVHISGSSNGIYQVSGALTNTTDGGEATHTLIENELPKISGRISIRKYSTSGGTIGATAHNPTGHFSLESGSETISFLKGTTSTNGTSNLTYEFGANGAHNNMQPYIVVNRWHRTA